MSMGGGCFLFFVFCFLFLIERLAKVSFAHIGHSGGGKLAYGPQRNLNILPAKAAQFNFRTADPGGGLQNLITLRT
jgi:hypothetical protein